jgi:hypothetical protein
VRYCTVALRALCVFGQMAADWACGLCALLDKAGARGPGPWRGLMTAFGWVLKQSPLEECAPSNI